MQFQTGTKIYPVHAIEFFSAGVGDFHRRRLHAGVVVCGIQTAEGCDGPLP
jgi:hypothetical protein